MMVSKTTTNFAGKRGIELSIETGYNKFEEFETLCIWESDNDCEWLCSYRVNGDGSFTWNANIYLKKEIMEELPALIKDEKHLRQVIQFISENI
ncbi:hypothetical protein HYL88_004777 [Salmonella enterica subsp. enterica serovar Infantis]|uniref:hypothetical protein n=1 Tax=Salmonella enterica TaxID=28901 RepID=UPI00190BC0BF|nr:hypothetical protein [Salmonella enterica]EFR5314033.1 hypothetical protein [Salmonella enterica subsp. enterica serovar Typhimurium]EFR5223068.1 hypothetical protein [Salmonella enterica subsp. enterica serovar Infantis]EFR5271517.1 hypothetical protein [Salmonella enterica subsp. enterica serovar Infantis]EFR5276671.1 hypothetical protein [Salmonella enterica subsp. enterica serovar Infantis]EFR5336145.1 hypothetical protein [Salmonella enterica subsp. enterica serovar Infantis]